MLLPIRFMPVAIGALLLFSCGSGSDDQTDSSAQAGNGIPDGPEISYEHLLDITDSEDVMFNRISDLRVTSEGDILIMDAGSAQAHLFDADGNYLNSGIGEGAGPGEARFPAGHLGMNENDEFVMHSQGLRRMSVYRIENREITPLTDISTSRFPAGYSLQPDGSILLFERASTNPDGESTERISLMDREGDIVRDAYITFPASEALRVTNPDGLTMLTFTTPNNSSSKVVFHGDTMVMINQAELGFRRYSLKTGELLTEVSIDTPDLPVTREENREFLESIMGALELSSSQVTDLLGQMPEVRGKLMDVRYDPAGYVWIKLLPHDEEDPKLEWLVFTEEGEFTGRMIQGEQGNILRVENGIIYLRMDDEDELPMVRVLRTDLL